MVLQGLQDFLKYLIPLPIPSLTVSSEFGKLSFPIYPRIYQTGYERFRLNKIDHHSGCGYYRGGWHPSYPALIPLVIYAKEKLTQMC